MTTIRLMESERRRSMFAVHSENRRITRKRHVEGCLIGAFVLFAIFAWWCNRPNLSHLPGAAPGTIAAPGAPLTADNAPVNWKREPKAATPAKAKRKAAK